MGRLLTFAVLTAVSSCGLSLFLTEAGASYPQQLAQATPSVTYPTLSAGNTGDSVRRLQATLKLLGFYQGEVDGTYSPTTQAAVSQFQSAAGISVDGIAGPSTWRKLLPSPDDIATVAVATPSTAPAAPATPAAAPVLPAEPTGPPILRPEVEGPAVAQLQRELQTLGYYDDVIDGIYGEATQNAVKAFQSDQQLEVDAIVGPSTWDALTRALG